MSVSLAPPSTQSGSLSGAEARAVCEFRDWLLATVPEQVERLILFGSRAREETHADSDVDLLLVLREQDQAVEDAVSDAWWEWLLAGLHIEVLTYESERFLEQVALGMPLMRNIALEGIPLIGEGIVMGEGKPEEVARRFLASARRRLRAARLLVEGGEYRDSISRSYYAVLDAADGALASIKITPKSHAGTLNLIGQHFVRTGRVDKKYSRLFKRIYKARLEADYERERDFTQAEAQEMYDLAVEFVGVIEELLE